MGATVSQRLLRALSASTLVVGLVGACGGSDRESPASRAAATTGPQTAVVYEEPCCVSPLTEFTGVLRADQTSGCLWLTPDPQIPQRRGRPADPPVIAVLRLVGRIRIDWAATPARILDRRGHVVATVGSRVTIEGIIDSELAHGCPVPRGTHTGSGVMRLSEPYPTAEEVP